MSKNDKKEVINISFLNESKESEDKPRQNDINNTNKNNNLQNLSKTDTKENLSKINIKKENNNTNNATVPTNIILNKKRERNESHNKEPEEETNNTNNNLNKKKMPLNEAKKEMKEFEQLIFNTEKEIQKKYGFAFPDLSYEDNLPDDIKNKLIDNFLERPHIKKILIEANAQK